jgi:hypothetical protein
MALLRQYWMVAAVLLIGAGTVLAISLSGGSQSAVMWAGGVIGVLTGIAIAASQPRDG